VSLSAANVVLPHCGEANNALPNLLARFEGTPRGGEKSAEREGRKEAEKNGTKQMERTGENTTLKIWLRPCLAVYIRDE